MGSSDRTLSCLWSFKTGGLMVVVSRHWLEVASLLTVTVVGVNNDVVLYKLMY